MNKKIITKAVWLISLVSLFTDMASEMLYPVMPFFLGSIGFSVFYIGLLEGFAEAVAGLSKPYFGRWSDLKQRRLPFVQLGYALSAISKPMMAIFFNPIWIFFARSIDRIGKGMRTGARDALLNEEADNKTKGTVFGFHRSMDTVGAVLGPLIALVFLYFYPHQYKTIFLLAFIPGIAAVICTFLLKEKRKPPLPESGSVKPGLFSFTHYWKKSPVAYKKLVLGLLLFAAFNSSDIFLLLKLKQAGMSGSAVVAVYILYNAAYAILAYPAGILADRLGMKKIFITGLIAFAAVYAGFAFTDNLIVYLLLFILYGFYAAATEGIAKAWICTQVETTQTATAIGTYTGFQSLAALFASAFCGLMWDYFGAATALVIPALVALVVAFYLYKMPVSIQN